jgi:hypothetical protein
MVSITWSISNSNGMQKDYEFIFSKYSNKLNNELKDIAFWTICLHMMMAHHLMQNAIKTRNRN